MINRKQPRFRPAIQGLIRLKGRVDGYSMIELVMVILLFSIAVPGLVGLYTSVLTNSHSAEIMTVAELLAVEQIEIILAHKGGSGGGFGYDSINADRYSSVDPDEPFDAYSRSVSVQIVNEDQDYEYKLITVTVNHDLIEPVALTTIVMDHSAIS